MLAKCRECGNNVSTEAEFCPHCGVPSPLPNSSDGSDASPRGEVQGTTRRGIGLERTRKRRKKRQESSLRALTGDPGALLKSILVLAVGAVVLWQLGAASFAALNGTGRSNPRPAALGGGTAGIQEFSLKDGYVVCEAPGQLSFFIRPNVFDFTEREAPESVPVYPDGYPGKKADMMVNGRFRTVTKGRKALERGWCHKTSDLSDSRQLSAVTSCGSYIPEIPNGGCRKVVIALGSRTEWYTFGDAIGRD